MQKKLIMPVLAVLLLGTIIILTSRAEYSVYSTNHVNITFPPKGELFEPGVDISISVTFTPRAGTQVQPVCTAWLITVTNLKGMVELGKELQVAYTTTFTKLVHFSTTTAGEQVIKASMLVKETAQPVQTATTATSSGGTGGGAGGVGGGGGATFDLVAGAGETEYYATATFKIGNPSITTTNEPIYFTTFTTNIITKNASFPLFPALAAVLLVGVVKRRDNKE